MPKSYQKSITVRKETYHVAELKAKRQKKTVATFVTDLILENCAEAQCMSSGSRCVSIDRAIALLEKVKVLAVEARLAKEANVT